MIKIVGQNKREGVKFGLNLFFVLSFFVGCLVMSYFTYTNPLATIAILIASIILFVYYTNPPARVLLEITEDYLKINNDVFYHSDIVAWSGAEYESMYEVVVRFKASNSVSSFYLSRHNPKTQEFIQYLSQKDPYDDSVFYSDTLLNFMKLLKVR